MVDVAEAMGEGGDVKWRVAVRQLKLVDVAEPMEEGRDVE